MLLRTLDFVSNDRMYLIENEYKLPFSLLYNGNNSQEQAHIMKLDGNAFKQLSKEKSDRTRKLLRGYCFTTVVSWKEVAISIKDNQMV